MTSRRILPYVSLSVCSMFFIMLPFVAHAEADLPIIDSKQIQVESQTLTRGYTASVQSNEVFVGIPAKSSASAYPIRIQALDGFPGTSRQNELHVGPVVEVDYDSSLSLQLKLRIKVQRTDRHFRVWLRRWNEHAQTWDRVRNSIDATHSWVNATITQPGIYTSFESTNIQEGKASWFRHKQKNVAANNFYPLGTRLKVTNLQTNKTVVVKIVSSGPFVPGRAIDLSYDAFKAIGKTGAGLMNVSVSAIGNATPTNGVVLGITDPPQDKETLSKVIPESDAEKNEAAGTKSTAYVALNKDSGKILTAHNAQKSYPIASMTKLITAMVVLDAKPDMNAVMEYTQDDNADGAKLYMPYGEKIRVKDLFYASLVGSANNATKLLSRSIGISKEAFVQRMNAKALEFGLKSATFVEPTGLEEKNRVSAYEYALIARQAFAYPEISKATITPVYSFRTVGTKSAHTIKNKNKILASGWEVRGTKTGYIDEAGNCLVSSVIGKTTRVPVIAVILGAPTDGIRYRDMDTVLSKAFSLVKNP